MAVRDWRGTTHKDVSSIVSAMQEQSREWTPSRYTCRLGRGATAWEAIPSGAAGIFASIEEAPDWSGRFSLTPGNGRGGAHCDIELFDRGSHREVTIRPAYTLGHGARAQRIMNGMIAAATR